jgi:hypothetical protein
MRFFRTLLAAVCLTSTLVAAQSAHAAPYGGSQIDVSNKTPPVNGDLKVIGKGFAPNSNVDVFFLSTPVLLGTFASDAVGTLTTTVRLPPGATGSHTIRLVGVTPNQAPLVLEAPITVRTATDIPDTGSNVSTIARYGLTAIAIGACLLLITAKRRRATA